MRASLDVTALWTLAVFFASVFAATLASVTLKRKYAHIITVSGWICTAVLGYILAFVAYSINITNDLVGILGLSALVCAAVHVLYDNSTSTKLFVSSSACLIANVCTFMFCGTTDGILAPKLGLIGEAGPYNTQNILFFIGIKLVVYAILFGLYLRFMRHSFINIYTALDEKLGRFLAMPLQAIVAFYIINFVTNKLGIMPGSGFFFWLYSMICLTFIVEYILLFNSVLWTSRALKTSAELDVARNIQSSSLPHDFSAFPELPSVDIFASMSTAKEVGGDFYDFFKIGNDTLCVVIADVSGKGVPAAMFMMRAKTLIRSYAETGQPIEEIIKSANRSLCDGNDAGMFVTLWAATINVNTGEMAYVNGGHNPPLLRRKDGSFEYLKMKVNFVLGSFDDVPYTRQELTLEHGDELYLYTDGVTEAMDVDGQLYGEERLHTVLNKESYANSNALCAAVKEDVEKFTIKAEPSDDMTMLSVMFR